MQEKAHRALLAEAHASLREGRFDDAQSQADRLLAQGGDRGEVCEILGQVAAARGDIPGAAAWMTEASDLLPKALNVAFQASHFNHLAGNFDAALDLIDRALALSPLNPTLFYARGLALGALGRHEEEIASYRKAIEIKDDFVDAYVNMGVALRDMRRFDDALAAFKTAIGLNPEHAGARTNRAQTNLILGNFEHGWRDYEWRWFDGRQQHGVIGKRWDGNLAALRGKVLLIHAEQGLGDTIQFVRYVQRFAGSGVDVVLRVPQTLVSLLDGFPGTTTVMSDSAPLPSYDFHVPLLSLPAAMYRTFPQIPADIPYLKVDPGLAQAWSYRLDERGIDKNRKRVGLVWSTERNLGTEQDLRKTDLSQWLSLFELDCQFVSLQKVVSDADGAILRETKAVWDPSALLDTMADTAALISQLDLVIAIDTSVVHVAGALGLPLWIALVDKSDWRWGLGREDSVWYPTARLFREERPVDMQGVIARIRSELAGFIGQHNRL